jgi:pimeloyl-ACP methyl ester carboxylesterase
LNHGWPGSFLEFVPLIEPLVHPADKFQRAFDVIIPSLPGFAFSQAPPANWTVNDTARIFNTLMTSVLGYKTYAVHGTDWGAGVAYLMYEKFNTTARAAHLNFLPFRPDPNFVPKNTTLSPEEKWMQDHSSAWTAKESAYYMLQTTKPNTIGLALQDSPVGQLAWIGEKMMDWSDPAQGTGPSVLNSNEILRTVSLYYLSRSFTSSVYTYAQNAAEYRNTYIKAPTDAPLLFTNFKWNNGFWSKEVVEQVSNLVQYFCEWTSNHE